MEQADDLVPRRDLDHRAGGEALLLGVALGRLGEEDGALHGGADLLEAPVGAVPEAVGPGVLVLGDDDPVGVVEGAFVVEADRLHVDRLVVVQAPRGAAGDVVLEGQQRDGAEVVDDPVRVLDGAAGGRVAAAAARAGLAGGLAGAGGAGAGAGAGAAAAAGVAVAAAASSGRTTGQEQRAGPEQGAGGPLHHEIAMPRARARGQGAAGARGAAARTRVRGRTHGGGRPQASGELRALRLGDRRSRPARLSGAG